MVDISQQRMTSASPECLGALRAQNADKRVIIATTNWGGFTRPVDGELREEEYRQHYAAEIGQKLNLCRFDGTHASAWAIIRLLAENTAV